MEIGSITSAYLNRIASSYASKSEEKKSSVSSLATTEYDSYEKSDAKDVKESYYSYESMTEKILGKDLETAVHNAKRLIYGLSSALINPDSSDSVTNYYDSQSVVDKVAGNSLEGLLGTKNTEKEENVSSVTVDESKEGESSGSAQGAGSEEDAETERKIVTRNGVRYVEITTTYSDGRTSVETMPLDGYNSKNGEMSNLMSML